MEDVYFTILSAFSIVEIVAFLMREQKFDRTYSGGKGNNLQMENCGV